ncbi:hypothetical protein EDB19DRAFT_1779732 [Suillus lakei]|nr:hypothetical protein EDB19DRAFT_1779732 [Suillus lakei]
MSIHQAFHKEMKDAFVLNRAGIETLFNDIVTRPDYLNIINHVATRQSLSEVVKKIEALGKRNNIFPPDPPLTLSVNYQGAKFDLETVFDLVGFIFSVTGGIAADATPANYYYPLVILYCKWCRTLAGDNAGKEPGMVQITWFTQGETKRVCLGGNLDKPKNVRKEAARIRRFDMLVSNGLALGSEKNTSYVDVGGQLIGHCAETFPVLFIQWLRDQLTLKEIRGVAVKPFKVLDDAVTDKFAVPDTDQKREELLADPCDNCQKVIPRVGAGIDLNRFSVYNL